jgi:DNA-binding NarL/FixJ family response regulator
VRSSNGKVIDTAIDRSNGYRVVVIDDHEMFGAALIIALRERGIQAQKVPVVGLAEFAARPCEARSGVVVLDLYLGATPDGRRIRGRDWIARLRDQGWSVLAVTGSEQDADFAAAIAEGAAGAVSKSSRLEVLLDAVALTLNGEPLLTDGERLDWEARHNLGRMRRQQVEERLTRLSAREREVLESIARGRRAMDIAEQSLVSITTVRAHIRSILVKFEVNSQIEAVALLRQCSDVI